MDNQLNLSDQELVRRAKAEELRSRGIDPFGAAFTRTANSQTINEQYQNHTKEQLLELNVKAIVAGRIMTRRVKGKAGFMHIQDRYGQLQIYVRSDMLSEEQFET
ncbi:MAG TPA: OB-fold nucleic acid binding domain-containing protein, partial [Bacilli bacterium]|nr:OB-fold nucleic acid binding domain-containing protein [Bacilli bacterium]